MKTNKFALRFSFEGLLIILSVFLTSLGSFYFYSIGLYVFQILGLMLAVVLCRRWPAPISGTVLSVLLLFFLAAYAYDAFLVMAGINTVTSGRLFLPVLFFLCYWFVCAAYQSPRKFASAIKFTVVLHCVFFLAQFFVFLFTGYLVDFLEPITGESQRALGGSYEIAFLPNFLRATGLYNEPGTYSTYLMIFLALAKDLEKVASFRSIGRFVELLVIVTVMLSFSSFGFVFVGLYLFFSFFGSTESREGSGSRTSRLALNILLLISILFCGYIFFDYFQQRFLVSNEQSGVEFRLFGLMNVLTNVSWVEMIFGKGFSAPIEDYDGAPLPIQDIGFWFGIFYYVGIVGTLVLGWCLISSISGYLKKWTANSYFLCLVAFALLCKLGFTNPLILIVLIYASIRGVMLKKFSEKI